MPGEREEGGIAAVIFDLDGVLVDSESVWGEIRERFTKEHGGRWRESAVREMQGMSSVEWSSFMHDELIEAARQHESYIAGETLATSVGYGADGAGETATIEGRELRIALSKA